MRKMELGATDPQMQLLLKTPRNVVSANVQGEEYRSEEGREAPGN